MLAARVLADHFEQVTVIERDQIPEHSDYRPGVPQARHLHFLLKRGLQVIEELFPGITVDLQAQGSHLVDQGSDFRILYRSGWSPRKTLGLELITFTRPLLETAIRRHLLADPRIKLLQGFEVGGLLLSENHAHVEGVTLYPRNHATNERGVMNSMAADLVVDSSGRGSKAPEWLEAAGFARPQETVVDAFWGYATRIYEPVEDYKKDWKTLFLMNRPPHQPRAGIIQPIEGNRWLVTVAGVMRDYPPTDEEGFLAFARSLSSPEIYYAIRDAKPLSGIRGFRRTANRLRHFEKLTRLPEGFVALGDSVCAFNPVYGQGMTLTCMQAMELQRCLNEGNGAVNGHTFHQRVAKLVAAPWALATGEDLRWPATQGGEINGRVRFMHWYIDQVIRLIPDHPDVYRRFQLVNHMLAGPETLFHPALLSQVLRQSMVPTWAKTALALLTGRHKKVVESYGASEASTSTRTVSVHTRSR